MASRYHAAVNRQVELEAKRREMLGEGSAATVEEMEKLLAEISANDKELATFKALHEAERTAPASSVIKVVKDEAAARAEESDPTGGFPNLGSMALAVRSACIRGPYDARLDALAGLPFGAAAPSQTHTETNSAEGWMVPPQYRDEIWRLVFEGTDILSLLNIEPTSSNSVELGADESTPWGSTGIQAYWRIEKDAMTASRLATKGRRVDLNELYAFVAATEELLSDAPRLNARLTDGAARAILWKASDAVMWADGVGKPLGWMNSPALVSVAKETGQAAKTINVDNIGKMLSRLYRGAGSRPRWFANSDILPQLLGLKIGDHPVWTPFNAGLQDAPGGRLLGIPIDFTEHAETLGTKGDLQLVDLAGYYATRRTDGIQFASSIHLWFDQNTTAFRWTFRIGGQPFLSAAISPAKGSTTKSHFVSLDTRA